MGDASALEAAAATEVNAETWRNLFPCLLQNPRAIHQMPVKVTVVSLDTQAGRYRASSQSHAYIALPTYHAGCEGHTCRQDWFEERRQCVNNGVILEPLSFAV